MNENLDTSELNQLADDLNRIGWETVAKTLRRATEEIERLRNINHDYERGMEITAKILTTLGRDPLPGLVGRLSQMVVLAEFREPT